MNPPFEYGSNVFDVIRDDPMGFVIAVIIALVLVIYLNWRIG